MRLLKVGSAVLNQTPLDWTGNLANVLAAIDAARAQRVQLLCLPELCLSGYGCEDAFHSPDLRRTARSLLPAIAERTKGIAVAVGLPVMFRSALFNCAALIAGGAVRGFVAKRHLAGDGLHYEPRWFKPWPQGVRDEILLDGLRLPIGDLFFEFDDVRVGFEICEDAWVAGRPSASFAELGIDVVLNPSASHFALGKALVRRRIVAEASRASGLTYVYSNLLGNESGRAIYDGGAIIATDGEIVAEGPRLGYGPWVLTTATVDVDVTRMRRARSASFRPGTEPEEGIVRVPLSFEHGSPEAPAPAPAAWERSPDIAHEELARSIALGLFDYLRKSKAKGFVVSLSGGVDSSSVCVLIWLMKQFSLAELGADALRARLPATDGAGSDMRGMLVTLYQSTRHSSTRTKHAASELSRAIGAEHHELDVDPIVRAYERLIEPALGRSLSWETDDLPLQNVQARVRSPGAWLLANVRGFLLLTTSNRSEAAVGYATMDGDTSGGLAPLAGVKKTMLRRWLDWMEKSGPAGVGAIPILRLVNEQAPTAELRPIETHQTDEDDLMPYEVLDAVEHAAIGEKRSPREVLDVLRLRFADVPLRQLAQWIERFFRLWCRNQWKRERLAVSFHVDDKNLDPRSWCRFPVLSGGYERELKEMWSAVPPSAGSGAPPGS